MQLEFRKEAQTDSADEILAKRILVPVQTSPISISGFTVQTFEALVKSEDARIHIEASHPLAICQMSLKQRRASLTLGTKKMSGHLHVL